ncbi:aerotaxis receptor Aer [Sulfurimicrobium lacus]|uniref:Aerotaxis receptor Aer n=1 Tax=Sulfurimicrobium lacus TaxID=2715678 RepID=A0A6F8V7T0_9PROT|nr:PAS domain-containing methyl-accepting chemotaxis protein [Sulfurimicrobium lacus]BCB25748.1 aerotaxis receptor Aer [Sulfurimicrobium lacus]
MKINLPVTQAEKPYPKGKYLVSKTDLKGTITYANDAFVELSGFSGEELIGKNHNLVRHPDMPPQAFEDLWRTVKTGRPWRGVVKNRSKNGDHYWVDAFVVPVRKNDQTLGYMSVRSEPSRQQVQDAERLYKQLNTSKARLDTSGSWWQRISVRARMIAVLGMLYLFMMTNLVVSKPLLGLSWETIAQVGGFAFFWILLTFVGFALLARSVMSKVNAAVRHFDKIAQGNLTDDIDISGRNEEGQLLNGLAAMQVHVKVMLDEISVASRAIEAKCSHLNAEMMQVVEQSEEQHDRVQAVASATEEFSQSVVEVAQSAENAASSAVDSQNLVKESNASMTRSMEATGRVVQAVQASSSTIGELNQAIEKIGAITLSIKEIADQTNLLALNAAIEAARAGEMGRGFAVVADEVRKLAERTTNSTADISAMVSEVQNVTRQAVGSMEQAAHEVDEGTGMMRESLSGLGRITSSSIEVTGMARHIADAAKEQAVASEQVAVNMEQVSALIEQNTSSAQQAWKATEELSHTAHDLKELVSHFELIKNK